MIKILPAGYTAQPANLKDAGRVVELYNAFGAAYLGHSTDNHDELVAFWQMPEFNLSTDVCLVLAPDGECAAIVDFVDRTEKHSLYNVRVVVHPRHEGRGIGSYLLEWAEERAQKSLALAPTGTRVTMQQGVNVRMIGNIDFLAAHGFEKIRNFYHMYIELDQPPPEAIVPDGFVIRPFEGEDERRKLVHAMWEAFRDHWGFIEEPFEKYYQRWMYRASHLKELDPGLWLVAVQDGAITGGCIGSTSQVEDPDMGWINSLGIRRAYRKHGLGLALLHIAFADFYRQGKKRVGLGVDASSLTGAVRLYEKAGMHVGREFSTYEKVLREGVELGTQRLRNE